MLVMRQPRWKIFEFFDIPVYVDVSFLVLLFLFLNSGGSFSFGLMQALVLGLSIVVHEYGHALTGRVFGCETHDINLSMIGGCASMTSMPRRGGQEFLVAIAGPLVSFALCGLGYSVLRFLPVENDFLAYTLVYLFYLNLVLGCFNLLPGFPMDGGRIFRSIARAFTSRAKATYAAMIVGRAFAVLLGLRGLHSIVTGGAWGFISIMIAWMIWREGWREYQMAVAEESWGGWDFSARVSPPPYGGDSDEAEVRRR